MPAAGVPPAGTTGRKPANRGASWLLAAWLAGALWSFARLGAGIIRLRKLRRWSQAAPPWVRHEIAWLARRMGILRPIEVRVCPDAEVPLTFGARSSVVLLPQRFAGGLRPAQIRLVLAHELAHVARRDYGVNLAQSVVEALLFFHPAVHWLSRIAREEREHCCDELAATVAGSRREVAGALVALEELVGARHSRSLAPAATGGLLLRRIERLIATASPPKRIHSMLSLGLLATTVALVILATPASARSAAPLGASPDPAGYSLVWSGDVASGERLRVRNLVGSIRVARAAGHLATIRARVHGDRPADLRFAPARDSRGVTVCAVRPAHGRCDAEGTTWFGAPEELQRAVIDLVVELPAGAAITAASFAGELVFDGVSGDVEARTGSGPITARLAPDSDARALELHTGAGDVTVVLPPGFDRNRVHASSGRGALVLSRGS